MVVIEVVKEEVPDIILAFFETLVLDIALTIFEEELFDKKFKVVLARGVNGRVLLGFARFAGFALVAGFAEVIALREDEEEDESKERSSFIEGGLEADKEVVLEAVKEVVKEVGIGYMIPVVSILSSLIVLLSFNSSEILLFFSTLSAGAVNFIHTLSVLTLARTALKFTSELVLTEFPFIETLFIALRISKILKAVRFEFFVCGIKSGCVGTFTTASLTRGFFWPVSTFNSVYVH